MGYVGTTDAVAPITRRTISGVLNRGYTKLGTPTRPAVYQPRQPRESPVYRVLQDHYLELCRTYEERYRKTWGPLRPVAGPAGLELRPPLPPVAEALPMR